MMLRQLTLGWNISRNMDISLIILFKWNEYVHEYSAIFVVSYFQSTFPRHNDMIYLAEDGVISLIAVQFCTLNMC